MAIFKKQHHNNMYFGDPTKLVRFDHKAKMAAKAAVGTDISVRLYIAQYNFVNTQPKGSTSIDLLPGQAMDDSGAYYDVTVTATDPTFEDVLIAAYNDGIFTSINIDSTEDAHFLTSFEFNSKTYSSITTGYYSMTAQTTPTDPEVNYYWAGWGITYFDGTHRPGSFETYPELAINQYPLCGDNLEFVLDFTKTEVTYYYV